MEREFGGELDFVLLENTDNYRRIHKSHNLLVSLCPCQKRVCCCSRFSRKAPRTRTYTIPKAHDLANRFESADELLFTYGVGHISDCGREY